MCFLSKYMWFVAMGALCDLTRGRSDYAGFPLVGHAKGENKHLASRRSSSKYLANAHHSCSSELWHTIWRSTQVFEPFHAFPQPGH